MFDQDHFQVFFGDNARDAPRLVTADNLLDPRDLPLRLLNARATGDPYMEGEFARIDFGEEFLSYVRKGPTAGKSVTSTRAATAKRRRRQKRRARS